MELRSFNVERVYNECVVCSIGENLGVRKQALKDCKPSIIDMVGQVERTDGKAVFRTCNLRKDGETWTPYLQIVEMLIRLGRKIGALSYEGALHEDTLISFKDS